MTRFTSSTILTPPVSVGHEVLHADRPDLCGEEPDWQERGASGRDGSR
jgi:hypothetical protein